MFKFNQKIYIDDEYIYIRKNLCNQKKYKKIFHWKQRVRNSNLCCWAYEEVYILSYEWKCDLEQEIIELKLNEWIKMSLSQWFIYKYGIQQIRVKAEERERK